MDARRANHALHYLIKEHAVRPEDIASPKPVSWLDLQRVHTPDWLEAISQVPTLAHVFAIDEADVVVDQLLDSVRLPSGGTAEAPQRAPPTGQRQPNPLAGADGLAGDKLGTLGLSVGGARQRDLKVLHHLGAVPSVWLPAGGYGPHAWKVLAGTGLALAFETDAAIPPGFDPLDAELSDV